MKYQKWHCICEACGKEKDPDQMKIMNVNCGETSVRLSLSLQVWQSEQMVAENSDVCEECFRKVNEHVHHSGFKIENQKQNDELLNAEKNCDIEKIENIDLNFCDQTLLKKSLSNDLDDTKIAILHGADVNAKDKDARTALMHAARYGHHAIIEFFLQHPDIDVNAKIETGDTALSIARKEGNAEIVKLLKKAGAV